MPTTNSVTDTASEALKGDYTYGVPTKKPVSDAPKAGNELDKDAFLKLLMAQLQYQDPLNPMDDRDFIAQMAQFTALEQMQNLNTAYAKSQAYEMIGRRVNGMNYIEATNSYEWVDGVVTSVKTINGEPYLVVDDKYDLALKSVENVFENVTELSIMQNINTNVANQQYLNLVGQYVQAVTRDENLKPTGYVEGEVMSVRFGAGGTKLIVGNREINPGEVIAVGKDSDILLAGRTLRAWYMDDSGAMQWQESQIDEVRVTANGFIITMSPDMQVPLENMEDLTNAYALIGETVALMDGNRVVRGTVTHIGIKNGTMYVFLDNEESPFEMKKATQVSS